MNGSFKELRNTKVKTIHRILIVLLSFSIILASLSANLTNTYGSVVDISNSIILLNPRVVDPNPNLIDIDGDLKNNVSLAANLTTERIGTIADAVSKLILLLDSNSTLSFSIGGTNHNNLTNGTLSSLNHSSNANNSSSTIIHPQRTSEGRSVVVAVYTPPDFIDLDKGTNHTTINILVNDTQATSIDLYRVPIVLVHGLWGDPNQTWIESNFNKTLRQSGFDTFYADYSEYNAITFDPYKNETIGNKPFGNYGIDSVRNETAKALKKYHNNSIAAAQVDIVGHSMGGLMARGFVQQADYMKQDNFMKGYIHRLITIGTPHFGGDLAGILYDHRDDWYCSKHKLSKLIALVPAQNCTEQPEQLKNFYNKIGFPLDQGGIESLIPGSDAYSHLCQTNVKSYAIAGSWKPNSNLNYALHELFYKYITGYPGFRLDEDAFNNEQNDLVVRLSSQLGGLLKNQTREQGENYTPPPKGAIYPNTIHSTRSLLAPDPNIFSEINSTHIQKDVVILLGSSDESKFADAIGIGSPCHVPNR